MSEHIEKILDFISNIEVNEIGQRTAQEIQEITDIEYILSFTEQLRDRDRSEAFTWAEEIHIAEQKALDEKLKAIEENLKAANENLKAAKTIMTA